MKEALWLTEDWETLTGMLPSNWRELARSTGALRRARVVSDPEQLLRLLLLHVGTGLSLQQTAVRAHACGLPKLSDVTMLNRLRGSELWLRTLAQGMLAQLPCAMNWRCLPEGFRVRAVDSSTISEPGSTGTDWRLHYSLLLPGLFCDHFELSDSSVGESLDRYAVAPNDLLLADRGYCRPKAAARLREQGAHFIMRWHSSSFPMDASQGQSFAVIEALRTLPAHHPGEWDALLKHGGVPLRLCAIRRSAASAEAERHHVALSARKSASQCRELTLELADYLVVVTTLSREQLPLADVLALYRLRWQIELAFKRLKSLLQAGHVPKHDPHSARAWLQGKLLVVLLIERMLVEAQWFSPWDMRCLEASRWQEFIEVRDSVLGVLSMPLSPKRLIEEGPAWRGVFRQRKRKRVNHRIKSIRLLS